MTYILYAADTSKGTSTYTQHTFMSLKELTQWCISSAFDEPSVSSTPLTELDKIRGCKSPSVHTEAATVSPSDALTETKPIPSFDLRGVDPKIAGEIIHHAMTLINDKKKEEEKETPVKFTPLCFDLQGVDPKISEEINHHTMTLYCALQKEKGDSLEDILKNIESTLSNKHTALARDQILVAARKYLNGDISKITFSANIPCEEWETNTLLHIMTSYRTAKCMEQLIPEPDTLKSLREKHNSFDRISPHINYGIPEKPAADEKIIKTDISTYIVEDLPEGYWDSAGPRSRIYGLVEYYSGNGSARESWWYASIPEYVKTYFVDVFCNDYITQTDGALQLMFGTDMTFLLNLYFKNPGLYSGNLSATSGVYWERLPEKFKNEARSLISTQTGILNESETIPCELFAVYKFLQAGRYLKGWEDSLNVKFGDIAWPNRDAAEELTLKIADEYGTLTKPTAALREFFVKLYTIQRYAQGSTTTIGSTEFLEAYVEDANAEEVSVREYDYCFLSLPPRFRKWLAAATTHKDCKAALESLGIQQVRRAEGQRYLNLRSIPFEPILLEEGKVGGYGQWKITGELNAFGSAGLAGF